VIHRAPTAIGASVKCEAVLESVNGKFLTFRVSANNGKEVIGYGTVGRAFVSVSKFKLKHESPAQEKS
jgi:predicted thioesterase